MIHFERQSQHSVIPLFRAGILARALHVRAGSSRLIRILIRHLLLKAEERKPGCVLREAALTKCD
jgi:hypothetical protein